MVARLVRDQKAAGSNPATSTAKPGCPLRVSRFCYVGGRDLDTRPVRPWVSEPNVSTVRCPAKPEERRTNQSKRAMRPLQGSSATIEIAARSGIPPRDTVQWTVATIEVAARSGIPPLRPLQARAATIERTVSNPSAISVSAAGIADASTRCLLRLTRSGRYRLWRFPHWGTASLAPHFDTPKAFVLKQSTKSLLTHTISMANHPNNYNNNLLSVPFFYHIIL